ncbi:alkane 1-monooxygenase [Hymenobacter sp. H14-R3]|uniref:alkane 1-monooxygenase n=1 Tax=Hymenobacter sp. H14-R3 TaxID=3046308 RepID=UPI0024BAA302|nr:alkane 1-monooxygenase [Hymenobacter sp. H14-R3]MDJ0365122.1 alkane 1-monooxygenase [Hymenobacter sp. H14-R3]
MLLPARDLRYLVAYVLPATAFLGLRLGGAWAWAAPACTFGLMPLLEWLVRPAPPRAHAPADPKGRRSLFFDGLLYLNVPLLLALLGYFLLRVHSGSFGPAATAGAIVTMGICLAALGINVAHELGHRSRPAEQRLALVLLLSCLYLHFFIAHNRGHHRHVATPLDPATSRLHEPFWAFLPRVLAGEYRSAGQLEATRLRRAGRRVWSGRNQLLGFLLAQAVAMGLVLSLFGLAALLAWLGAAVVGVVILQLVNYVEHYGLQRRRTAEGLYERVQPHHSWNSEHLLGRIVLYELTRHSDHHYQAARPYQTLRFHPTSPQMPTGYPGMMLLATIPPLWFRVMNRRVPQVG